MSLLTSDQSWLISWTELGHIWDLSAAHSSYEKRKYMHKNEQNKHPNSCIISTKIMIGWLEWRIRTVWRRSQVAHWNFSWMQMGSTGTERSFLIEGTTTGRADGNQANGSERTQVSVCLCSFSWGVVGSWWWPEVKMKLLLSTWETWPREKLTSGKGKRPWPHSLRGYWRISRFLSGSNWRGSGPSLTENQPRALF